MGSKKLESKQEIEDVAFDVLKQSGALGKFPTPVDQIVQFSELRIDESNDITSIPKNYLGKTSEALKKALRKLTGMYVYVVD